MKNIDQLVSEVIREVGEETCLAELEGILRKHRGIRTRSRKPGAVRRCVETVAAECSRRAEPPVRLAARVALTQNLSQASVYRMVRMLKGTGVDVKAAAVLREMDRIKKGVY